jgi:peroxiredoxin
MYNKRPGEPIGPSMNICPNCGHQKTANKALCPNCSTRSCPRDACLLSDSQWICPKCRWKDDDWRPKKRNLSRSAGERQFEDIYIRYYRCPKCTVAFASSQLSDLHRVSCPGCGQMMGDGTPFKITLEEFKKAKSDLIKPDIEVPVQEFAEEIPVATYTPPSVTTVKKVPATQSQTDFRYIESPVGFEISKHREHFREEMGTRGFKMPSFKKFIPVFYGLGALAVLVGIGFGVWALISSGAFSRVASTKPAVQESLAVDSVQFNSVSDFGARITWRTDKPSTSQVEYGTTPNLGEMTAIDTQMVTDHSVNLNNLKGETTYYFRVKSTAGKAASGAVAVSQFKTAAPPDNAPPVISDIKIARVSDTDAVVSWKTSENSTGTVRFGTNTSYGQSIDAGREPTLDHSVKLKDLSPATSYHFSIAAVDRSKNEAVSADTSFLTLEAVKVGYNVGNRAPDFTLQTVDGKPVSLSALRGEPVVLNFWRIACPACVFELPFIEDVYKSLNASKQVVKPQIYTVNLMDYAEHVNNLLNENHYTFPILMDFKGEAMYAYSLNSIPATFFIDADGIIRKVQIGRFDSADELREILNSL